MSHFISKSGAGKAATLCVMLLLAGCSTYFSKPALYVPRELAGYREDSFDGRTHELRSVSERQ
jgi:hypothetical protein